MKFLITIVIGMTISWAAAAYDGATLRPAAEGLPLPWPFPWAKECPVDWQSMQGRYLLSDSSNQEQIDLKITVVTSHGFRLVRMSRYSRNGEMIADGFNFVSLNQRMLRMRLVPKSPFESPIWALVKLHYSDWNLGCAADHLVPILTLERANSSSSTASHYRLVRIIREKD